MAVIFVQGASDPALGDGGSGGGRAGRVRRPGTYAQIRSGFALGSMGKGNMWLKNGNGVLLHLADRERPWARARGISQIPNTASISPRKWKSWP